jgi:hypothetical protein
MSVFAAACVLVSGAASAQGACPEGRAANGQCVNPGLADAMRQTAMIYSQPKISDTQYPVLPSDDGSFRYPNQLNPNPLQPSGTLTPLSRR